MKNKILFVEDDPNQAAVILLMLKDAGYETRHFTEVSPAWEWLKGHEPDMILTDVELPDMSGMEFCTMVRRHPPTSALPLLMLTVRKEEEQKVRGLKSGADDYLTKPFSKKELLARLEALLRRSQFKGKTERILESKGLWVNLDRAQVRVNRRRVALLPKEFDLLVSFLQNQGRVLTHESLEERVWGFDREATSLTLKAWISRLRKKLGPLGRRLEAVKGRGYKFE